MFRTVFGDPRPYGFDELMTAIEESGISVDESDVVLDFETSESGPNCGWCASISGPLLSDDDVDGDGWVEFSTYGYADKKEELVSDLRAAGFKP